MWQQTNKEKSQAKERNHSQIIEPGPLPIQRQASADHAVQVQGRLTWRPVPGEGHLVPVAISNVRGQGHAPGLRHIQGRRVAGQGYQPASAWDWLWAARMILKKNFYWLEITQKLKF